MEEGVGNVDRLGLGDSGAELQLPQVGKGNKLDILDLSEVRHVEGIENGEFAQFESTTNLSQSRGGDGAKVCSTLANKVLLNRRKGRRQSDGGNLLAKGERTLKGLAGADLGDVAIGFDLKVAVANGLGGGRLGWLDVSGSSEYRDYYHATELIPSSDHNGEMGGLPDTAPAKDKAKRAKFRRVNILMVVCKSRGIKNDKAASRRGLNRRKPLV